MSNFRQVPRPFLAQVVFAVLAWSGSAHAQTTAQGFALERFYPSPAGAGWFVMDDLRIQGGLNGAVAVMTDYERNPLALSAGTQRLAVVSTEAFADLCAAVSYHRIRLSLDFPMPLVVSGESGTLGQFVFKAPAVNLGSNPDSISDVRVGVDARLYGNADEPFRVGVGAQLLVPSNSPVDTPASYLTDATLRAMFRALFAGDLGPYRYAGQLGIHVRPLNESPTPGSPEGSELLFGAAVGRRFAVGDRWAAVVGPEVFGETAFARFFGGNTTGVEALLTGRFEGTGDGAQVRAKAGVGAGLDPQFGTPEWRVVLGIELFSRRSEAGQ